MHNRILLDGASGSSPNRSSTAAWTHPRGPGEPGAAGSAASLAPPGDGVELSAAAQQAAAEDGNVRYAAVGQFPRASALASSADKNRLKAVKKAMKSGQPVTFRNSDGQKLSLSVLPATPNKEGNTSYTVAFDGYQVQVNLEPGIDAATAVSRVANFISQYPPHLRNDLKAVNMKSGALPSIPNAIAWVNGHQDSGEINFQFGNKYLKKSVFDHEMGHIVGDFVEDRQASPEELAQEQASGGIEYDPGYDWVIPEGWGEAIAKDNRSVSEYGNTNQAEDFAEFWEAFMQAEAKGLKSRAMKQLGKKYPHRTWIALHIYHGLEYRPAPPPAAAPPASEQPAA